MSEEERIGSIYPGEVIRKDFLVPLGKNAGCLAKGLGIPQTAVGEMLRGKWPISPETALRLERFLGCSAEFWLGLQASYDLDEECGRLPPHREETRPADLSRLTGERQRAVEARLEQMTAALPKERMRLAAELAAIQPREAAAARLMPLDGQQR
jgi:antitoxin HigA-1